MIEKRIYDDYVTALKSGNKEKAEFLSFVRAELKNAAIASKKDSLDDADALGILLKMKKRLDDAKTSIGTADKNDFLRQTEREIAILGEYLPKALSESELAVLVEEVVKGIGAVSIKDMGRVMKEAMAKSAGRADSKALSDLVKKRLSA